MPLVYSEISLQTTVDPTCVSIYWSARDGRMRVVTRAVSPGSSAPGGGFRVREQHSTTADRAAVAAHRASVPSRHRRLVRNSPAAPPRGCPKIVRQLTLVRRTQSTTLSRLGWCINARFQCVTGKMTLKQ